MAKFLVVDASARERIKNDSANYLARDILRKGISSLEGADLLEFELDAGESMRKLKVNVRRAAQEVNREVLYGETIDSTLLVWVKDATPSTAKKRTYNKKKLDVVK